ncbi:DUF1810 domain-containing protein [Olivibacter ginsenosidimutans]|uniref:DUF1810 domain-containing protein n=1 Tax=Olivibacter ginsenosidimutans TaxID=1176537 RepID=A0ABP9BJ23_9SPHI
MNESYDLERFLTAQDKDYAIALTEIKNGQKKSHWMWYIFPQIKGLGYSELSQFYAINDLHEAQAYLEHPILGERFIHISNELFKLPLHDARSIFGYPDDLKLRSSLTLFQALPHTNPIFQKLLTKFFQGKKDDRTLQILANTS